MGAARKKSGKRSGTSGGAPPREPLEFFVDECLGRKAVPEALLSAGHRVHLHSTHFDAEIDDIAWLSALRPRRSAWIVLTKDSQIRKRPAERQALMAAGLRVFALTAANLSSIDQANAFVRALNKIRRLSKQAGPFIARVTASGDVKIIDRPKPGRRKQRRFAGSTS